MSQLLSQILSKLGGLTGTPINVSPRQANKLVKKYTPRIKTGTGKGTTGGFDLGKFVETGTQTMRAVEGDPIAIAQLAKKSITDKIESAKETGQEAMKTFQSERMGATLSHGAKTAFAATDTVLGPAKDLMPLYQVTKQFTVALLESIDKVKDFTHHMHDANMQFAESSGKMAGVQARQEVREFQLERERGERRADSAEKLAVAMNKLDRSTAKFEDEWANVKTEILIPIVKNMIAAVKILEVSLAPAMSQLKQSGRMFTLLEGAIAKYMSKDDDADQTDELDTAMKIFLAGRITKRP